MHAVRGPHLRYEAPRGGSQAGLRQACPTSARLFGDIHDAESLVARAIRDNGGYALMPEWGTQPANHYLPRRKTSTELHPDELTRQDNPLKVDGLLPRPATSEPALDDVTSW